MSWSGSPTRYTYRWYRNGTLLAEVTGSTYTLHRLDEGSNITCAVTAYNAGGPATGKSNAIHIPVPHVARCPAATGKMTGEVIGLVRLGMTRNRARFLFRHHSDRGRRYEDFFCLTPIRIRVGYATPFLSQELTRQEQKKLQQHVVWASTSNPYYSGEWIKTASRRLGTGRPFHVGHNFWWLARKHGYTAVLKVRHGVVREIGIADNRLTATRRTQGVLMHSFY